MGDGRTQKQYELEQDETRKTWQLSILAWLKWAYNESVTLWAEPLMAWAESTIVWAESTIVWEESGDMWVE